jgi:hypothetical protein
MGTPIDGAALDAATRPVYDAKIKLELNQTRNPHRSLFALAEATGNSEKKAPFCFFLWEDVIADGPSGGDSAIHALKIARK